jgi:predicted transcriptional regulator
MDETEISKGTLQPLDNKTNEKIGLVVGNSTTNYLNNLTSYPAGLSKSFLRLGNWYIIISDMKYAEIILFLLINKVGHLRGLSKISKIEAHNLPPRMRRLERLGIVQKSTNEREINKLKIFLRTRPGRNIGKYHLDKIVCYGLTTEAKAFFGGIREAVELCLGEKTVKKLENYKYELAKSHKKVKKERRECLHEAIPIIRNISTEDKTPIYEKNHKLKYWVGVTGLSRKQLFEKARVEDWGEDS